MSYDQHHGTLFVLVGPGGTGKNTLMNAFMKNHPEVVKQLATATTRPKRDNEEHGREHLFVSLDEFRRMLANNELLEHQEVTPTKYYGIPRASVENSIYYGRNLIADIEVRGAEILRQTYPEDVVLIFVTVPGKTIDEKLRVLQHRMIVRLDRMPTEQDREDIQHRLDRALKLEFPFESQCQYTVVNDEFPAALEHLDEIIMAHINEKCSQTARA
jgi:guanylate kinase